MLTLNRWTVAGLIDQLPQVVGEMEDGRPIIVVRLAVMDIIDETGRREATQVPVFVHGTVASLIRQHARLRQGAYAECRIVRDIPGVPRTNQNVLRALATRFHLLAHSTHSFDSLQRIAAANERLVKQLWSERSREDHSRALRSDALAEERLAQTLDEKDEEK